MQNNELRGLGSWWLPKPSEFTEWMPIPRLRNSRQPPFGYMLANPDDDVYMPVPVELEYLEQAKRHLKKYTLKHVAAWLSVKTGRSITGDGLKTRIDSEKTARQRAARLRRAAAHLEATIKKAEKWEAFIQNRKQTRYEANLYSEIGNGDGNAG